ncbi:hypothetical protein K1T71_003961 [Dendrolimus kikuchii]|uniref:Uncharacterized protein n=1 Tax=Dendrolimus kikuchii TaxID=765133 RepID=A0ACC1D9M0_9NEOP|nr:hypothetical protein K1T71_003961 [Dendrolimus kikuchii]
MEQDQRFSNWQTKLDSTLSVLVRDVSDLKTQWKGIQKSNFEIEKSMDYINCAYEEIKFKISCLENEKKEFEERIVNLERQLQDVNLQSRLSTMELRNVPTKLHEKPEDLKRLVFDIGKVLNLNITNADIRDIYRIPGKSTGSKPIVAEFVSVSTRNQLLSAARQYNKSKPIAEKLNTETLGISGAKEAIYIDEHLSPMLRKLMYETLLMAKAHNYSCWHANGKILVRIHPDGKPIQIKSQECVTFLVKKTGNCY